MLREWEIKCITLLLEPSRAELTLTVENGPPDKG